MKRVLVTGASGFIGRRTLEPLLERGYDVHAVSLGRDPGVHGVTYHPCDLLDPAARAAVLARVGPTQLLHLAWYAEYGKFWTSPENVSWSAATLELTRSACEGGCERAVFAGSCAEYDWSHGYCREGITPMAPRTLYGVAKDATRRLVEAYAAATGLAVAWGRVFHLYGPGDDPRRLVASVARCLLAGTEALTSHGEQLRDFSYVSDVAGGLVALLDSNVSGPVNIASGEPVRLRRVAELIGELTGRPELVRIGALPAPADDSPCLVADVSRLRNEVGFAPAYDLAAGLTETIAQLASQTKEPS